MLQLKKEKIDASQTSGSSFSFLVVQRQTPPPAEINRVVKSPHSTKLEKLFHVQFVLVEKTKNKQAMSYSLQQAHFHISYKTNPWFKLYEKFGLCSVA